MRRKDKEVTDPRIIAEILTASQICRLGMVDEGKPYIVPLNYGYQDNALYIHSAAVGRKIEILKKNSAVCFEIETSAEIVTHAEACRWGTKARSLIGYGRVEFINDLEGKKRALDIIMSHFGKKDPNVYDEKYVKAVVILKLSIESITCKQLGQW